MERLTQMVHPGLGYCWTKLAFSDVAIMEDMIIDRLGAYEDIGLTPDEILNSLKNFSSFLMEMTGNKMSNTNYTLDAMLSVANDYQQSICDECEDRIENADLIELLKLAVEDIKSLSKHFGICHHCINSSGYCNRCKLGKTVNASFCNDWQWQHADKLKELGVE